MTPEKAYDVAKALVAEMYAINADADATRAAITDVADALLAASRPGEWVTTPPTVPGWWWYREGTGPRAVNVVKMDERGAEDVLCCLDGGSPRWLSNMTGEWCGPLEVPT